MLEGKSQKYIQLLEETVLAMYQRQEYQEMLMEEKDSDNKEALECRINELKKMSEVNLGKIEGLLEDTL